jgi:PKD repeat protein
MARQLIIIFGYVVATAIVVLGTIALIAYGNGVSYDVKTGRLVHNGLIILQSTPSGAAVTLSGKVQHQQTPYRHTFRAGSYDFTLTKTGYRTWQKALWVVASEADLAQYVILLPQHLVVSDFGTYPSITQSLETRDHHLIGFVVPNGPTAGVWTFNTSNHQQTRIYASAPATATTPAETVQLLSWADDNSRLLIQSQVGGKSSLLVVSTGGGGAPVDLDATFKQDIDTAIFNPANSQQLYWRAGDGTLRRLDLSDQVVSPVLADHVAAFAYAANNLLYIDTATPKPSLWSLDSSSNKTELIASVPPSTTYELAFATYIGTPEVAVASQDSHTVTLYSDIYSQPVTTRLPAPGQHVAFNGDGRFLLQYDGQHVATYDLQRNLTYRLPAPNSAVTGISWFDNYHLVFNRGGQIVLSEFDGNYANVVTRGNTLPPAGSEDTKSIVATSSTSTGATLLKAIKIRQ